MDPWGSRSILKQSFSSTDQGPSWDPILPFGSWYTSARAHVAALLWLGLHLQGCQPSSDVEIGDEDASNTSSNTSVEDGYDMSTAGRAWLYSEAAYSAQCGTNLEDWTCSACLRLPQSMRLRPKVQVGRSPSTDVFAFAGIADDGSLVIAFRGTSSLRNIWTDARFFQEKWNEEEMVRTGFGVAAKELIGDFLFRAVDQHAAHDPNISQAGCQTTPCACFPHPPPKENQKGTSIYIDRVQLSYVLYSSSPVFAAGDHYWSLTGRCGAHLLGQPPDGGVRKTQRHSLHLTARGSGENIAIGQATQLGLFPRETRGKPPICGVHGETPSN